MKVALNENFIFLNCYYLVLQIDNIKSLDRVHKFLAANC